jgi:hypothetical protein
VLLRAGAGGGTALAPLGGAGAAQPSLRFLAPRFEAARDLLLAGRGRQQAGGLAGGGGGGGQEGGAAAQGPSFDRAAFMAAGMAAWRRGAGSGAGDGGGAGAAAQEGRLAGAGKGVEGDLDALDC